MPNKFLNCKGIEIKKQKYKVKNWSVYNEALKHRGDIDVWLSQEVIDGWYDGNRVFDGTGTPDLYTDLAIITCHEIRKVSEWSKDHYLEKLKTYQFIIRQQAEYNNPKIKEILATVKTG